MAGYHNSIGSMNGVNRMLNSKSGHKRNGNTRYGETKNKSDESKNAMYAHGRSPENSRKLTAIAAGNHTNASKAQFGIGSTSPNYANTG